MMGDHHQMKDHHHHLALVTVFPAVKEWKMEIISPVKVAMYMPHVPMKFFMIIVPAQMV